MDMRLVAAAGAAYFSKFCQNVGKDNEASSAAELCGDHRDENSSLKPLPDEEFAQTSDEEFGQTKAGALNSKNRDNRSPFQKRTRKNLDESIYPSKAETPANSDERLPSLPHIDGPSVIGAASTTNQCNSDAFGEGQDSGTSLWSTTWQPYFSPSSFSTGNGFGRGRSRLNSKWARRFFSVKPMTSLESCVVAQMYRERVEMEENVFSSLSSSSKSVVRPSVVSHENQVINRASTHFSSTHFEAAKRKLEIGYGIHSCVVGTSSSIHPFSKKGSMELPYKARRTSGKHGSRRVSNVSPADRSLSSPGLHHGMALFGIGIAFGVMTMIISKNREVENLNTLLQQTQNLVQDLQEELEMKDLLTFKELKNEKDGSKATSKSFADKEAEAFLHVQSSGVVMSEKTNEGKDPISKIEAELEAELERLELNMKASSREAKLCGLVEIDPKLEADVVLGELKVDKVDSNYYSNSESGETSDNGTPPANYAVSPTELSLRLHEVVQTRLQERIVELELELSDTKRRLHLMEVERVSSRRDYSNSENESPPMLGSPTLTEQGNPTLPPVCMKLSGDALNAYSEAYDEFLKIYAGRESSIIVATNERKQGNGNGGRPPLNLTTEDASFLASKDEERSALGIPDYDEIKIWERSRDSLEVDESEEEDYDEFGKMLIEQIMEKTRQGSPAVFNACKLLLVMDEQL